MRFEWDANKAKGNILKHKITFDEASTVFGDKVSLTITDPDNSESEERWIIFGQSSGSRLMVVSFTDRGNIIRIISAREMTPSERRAYES